MVLAFHFLFLWDLGDNGKFWEGGRSQNHQPKPDLGRFLGSGVGEEGGDGETQPEWDKSASSPFVHGRRILGPKSQGFAFLNLIN